MFFSFGQLIPSFQRSNTTVKRQLKITWSLSPLSQLFPLNSTRFDVIPSWSLVLPSTFYPSCVPLIAFSHHCSITFSPLPTIISISDLETTQNKETRSFLPSLLSPVSLYTQISLITMGRHACLFSSRSHLSHSSHPFSSPQFIRHSTWLNCALQTTTKQTPPLQDVISP